MESIPTTSAPLTVRRATHLGMCFGVRDAIKLARSAARQQPVTVLGELVHNDTVLSELRAEGVEFARDSADAKTQAVLITAHGTSDGMRQRLASDGFQVLDSTCPLVHVAHCALQDLVSRRFHPVVVGQSGHVEVRGLTGDLTEFDIVLTESDVNRLLPRELFGVVSQTTQPIERVRHLVQLIRNRFPQSEVCFRDTICQPTKQRQSAAIELARTSDLVIVVGGANSNNTRELVATCSRYCSRVHHVQTAADLRAEWCEGIESVGLTAGTSTPDSVIDAVESRVLSLAAEIAAASSP